MATSNLTVKKGQCINLGNCKKADTKEVIDINLGEDFICPECEGTLVEIVKKPLPKWILYAAIAVIVAGLGTATCFFLLKNSGSENQEGAIETVEAIETAEQTPIEENVIEEEPPIDDLSTYLNNGAVQSGNDGAGKISTEYGNYTGDLKDEKANGNGVFQVFKRIRISRHDERIAEEGDYLVGQYANNEVIQAKWFDKDKQQKGTIIIGRKGVE